ncbi:PREDICTED: probable chromo domain-containing protein LHP1 [Wasmannia auropunctata]|uniref:probable chromo domain-containing protein LHP1 n=1 Tax=Wasmannia auropunctata TaxID=64793 RepID=UPI0005EDD4D7|nr:PREDICTED: probable chromo domain-containing protein LHP1 [Wasmannia auropunctata]XP_011697021.1 PREDICTED: probable chromo domain-containing protein LHP1 [Wasmannia auropunctata]XP_011697022.1 PREDICTED: probable chromo domain-containing protein LHP1 [Wasmannia auropunctata]
MRRLGMKNKHKKSDTASDSGSEENVGARAGSDNGETQAGRNNNNAQKSATKRRSSRGVSSVQKSAAHTDDDAETPDAGDPAAVDSEKRENGEKMAGKPPPSKRKRKEDQRASTSARDQSVNLENEYEVEKLMNIRTIKGRRQFLVRWFGYGESADTWENEKDLNCPELIEDFLEKEKEKEIKMTKTDKSKKSKNTSKKQAENDEQNSNDKETKEFEVERIIEVRFKKNGMKEFLIRWKGFSATDDTWEPEKNLNCAELISKFMQKVEKAKTSGVRELRTNPAHTKRYTLATRDHGRRLSKRNIDKQRATYHECDE